MSENNFELSAPAQEKKPVLRTMEEIAVKPVDWLWYPYIPFGKVTILQGDPGCGKTMVALDLAARLSRGASLPFLEQANAPIRILYQTAEDGIDDTIKPRLLAAGADCSNISFVEETDDPLTFTDERIEKAIRESGAKMLILDPLSAYIGADINLNNPIAVRAAFRPLYEVADRTKCAVLIIAHINKQAGLSALYHCNVVNAESLRAIFRKPVKPQLSSVTISGDTLKEYADILPDAKEVERLFLEFLKTYRCSVAQPCAPVAQSRA